MTRLKAFVSSPLERADAEPHPCIALDQIQSATGRLMPGVEIQDKVDESAIAHRAGDVRFGKLRPYLAKSLLMETDGIGSGELLVLRPRSAGILPRFLWYVTLSKPFLDWADITSYGVKMPRTNWDAIGEFDVDVPSPSVQREIVGCLDSEISRIDVLIWEEERLVALLRERHFVLTSHALGARVGGPPQSLDTSLSVLPESWEIVPLRQVADIQSGITLGKKYNETTIEYPYLRVANVHDGEIDTGDVSTISVPSFVATRHLLRAGDVLMTEGGDNDKLGRGSLWSGSIAPCLHQNHIFAVRTRQGLRPEFLAALLGSSWGRAYFTATAHQTTNLASTNRAKVGRFPIPLPPLAEQAAILEMVGREGERVSVIASEAENQIRLLREHRQALITAAVTGKLTPIRSAA